MQTCRVTVWDEKKEKTLSLFKSKPFEYNTFVI